MMELAGDTSHISPPSAERGLNGAASVTRAELCNVMLNELEKGQR